MVESIYELFMTFVHFLLGFIYQFADLLRIAYLLCYLLGLYAFPFSYREI